MTSSLPSQTYLDAESEAAHRQTFTTTTAIPAVLPPGVTQDVFDSAIGELVSVLGHDSVFLGEGLAHYVDPYDASEERRVPSAAVT